MITRHFGQALPQLPVLAPSTSAPSLSSRDVTDNITNSELERYALSDNEDEFYDQLVNQSLNQSMQTRSRSRSMSAQPLITYAPEDPDLEAELLDEINEASDSDPDFIIEDKGAVRSREIVARKPIAHAQMDTDVTDGVESAFSKSKKAKSAPKKRSTRATKLRT